MDSKIIQQRKYMKKLILAIILTIARLFGFIEYKNRDAKSSTNYYKMMRGEK